MRDRTRGGKCGWSSRNSAVAIVAAAAFAFAFSARAQQPETKPAPKPEEAAQPAEQSLLFEVIRFQVDGSTLMKPEAVQRLLAPFTGKQKDFSDIHRPRKILRPRVRSPDRNNQAVRRARLANVRRNPCAAASRPFAVSC